MYEYNKTFDVLPLSVNAFSAKMIKRLSNIRDVPEGFGVPPDSNKGNTANNIYNFCLINVGEGFYVTTAENKVYASISAIASVYKKKYGCWFMIVKHKDYNVIEVVRFR